MMKVNELIIDGVDVLKCEHFTQEQPQFGITCLFYAFKNKNKCEDSKNCYYKQLQRKIQECEKLKESNQAWGLTVTHLRAELEEERKKTMWITQNNKIWYSEEEHKKLQQALEEIRDIAENSSSIPCAECECDCENCSDELTNNGKTCMQYGLDKIISKINEVLNK